jgi:hypothetical protein
MAAQSRSPENAAESSNLDYFKHFVSTNSSKFSCKLAVLLVSATKPV